MVKHYSIEQPELKCDFCSAPPKWWYKTDSFQVMVIAQITGLPADQQVCLNIDGDWAACDACKDLIEAKDWDALVTRSLETMPREGVEVPAYMRDFVMTLHKRFREELHPGGPRPAEEKGKADNDQTTYH